MFPVHRLQNPCERSTFPNPPPPPRSVGSRLFVVLNLDKVIYDRLKFFNVRFNFKLCFKNSIVDAFWGQ